MRKLFFILIIIGFLLFIGCSKSTLSLEPKAEVSFYQDKIVQIYDAVKCSIDCDSSNIDVYSWDKLFVKFEIKKIVRGIYKKEILRKSLDDFRIDCENDNDKISYKSSYRGEIEDSSEYFIDLKVFLPKKIKFINYKLGAGRINFNDDFKGELIGVSNTANVELNKFDGKIILNGDMGNIKISNAKLKKGSSLISNIGNIQVKGNFEQGSEYFFETNRGNIDISLPSKLKLNIKSVGVLAKNEFINNSKGIDLSLKSGMGKISVSKY